MPLVLERVICSVNPSFATYSRVTKAIFRLQFLTVGLCQARKVR